MKHRLFVFLAMSALLLCACQETERWTDNTTNEIYFPQYGFSLNDIWSLSDGGYETYVGIYCGGVRPDNQNSEFTVSYSVDNSIIDEYNADITQQYSGQVEVLPEGCYKLIGDKITVKNGEVSGKLPIRFNVDVIRGRNLDSTKYYAIPLKLTSTEKYALSSDASFVKAIYAISVNEPRFYFYCNRDGVLLNGVKLVYGTTDNVYRYEIGAYGVPDGSYDVKVAYDPKALTEVYPSVTVIPEDAFKLTSSTVKYKSATDKGVVEVEYFPDKLNFSTSYYLPLSITEASPYGADALYKTLYVKVDVKNEYDKTYTSNLLVDCEGTSRTGAYSVNKDLIGTDSDIVEFQMCTNTTIAGAKATGTSTTYNNKYMRLRVIPTADKSRYDLELILVKDKSATNNSPATLEFIPGADNYYDWNQEKFVLNYRWQHTDKSYINVSEVLQAQ